LVDFTMSRIVEVFEMVGTCVRKTEFYQVMICFA
jgi:hypothetical protein